jgi:hypothetical protein
VNGAWVPVNQAVVFPVPVLPDPAKTSLAFSNPATLWTEIALNLSSTKRGKVGRNLCLYQALLGRLSLRSSWQKVSDRNGATTHSAKLQKFPFGHTGIQSAMGMMELIHNPSEGNWGRVHASDEFVKK